MSNIPHLCFYSTITGSTSFIITVSVIIKTLSNNYQYILIVFSTYISYGINKYMINSPFLDFLILIIVLHMDLHWRQFFFFSLSLSKQNPFLKSKKKIIIVHSNHIPLAQENTEKKQEKIRDSYGKQKT